jgi:hypothetical protein
MKPEISPLELDLILFFYTFADQHGKVNIERARAFVEQRWGIILSNKPVTITQLHVDLLAEKGIIPDIGPILQKMKSGPPKKIRSKKK